MHLYSKLSPRALRALGLSARAERYIGPTGDFISKRQYQQAQLAARAGKPISLEARSKLYQSTAWQYPSVRLRLAAQAKRDKSAARRQLHEIARTRDYDKATLDALSARYGEDFVREILSPTAPRK